MNESKVAATTSKQSFLRWTPAFILGLAHAVLWSTFLIGKGMPAIVGWVLLLSVLPLLGTVVLLFILVYSLWKRRFSRPIAVTFALSLLALWPGAWNLGVLRIPFPSEISEANPAATIRLPANKPLRVAWGGDRLASNYHAFSPDQRWAYDLTVEPSLGGSARFEDYGCWGTEVVAPTTAKVHLSHDGEPDVTPGHLSNNVKAPLGNFVAFELEGGTFLIVAHLQKGSIKVKEGEIVTEGFQIGTCGNSGNTSEPHIHIHHQRQDPGKFPVNFAEGLPLYFRDHDGPLMPEGGFDMKDGKMVARGAIVQHRAHHGEQEH